MTFDRGGNEIVDPAAKAAVPNNEVGGSLEERGAVAAELR